MRNQDVHPQDEVSLVELTIDHWSYLLQFVSAYRSTYLKVLVPMDLLAESEGVLPLADELLRPEGQGILLHVITKGSTPGAIFGQSRQEHNSQDWNRFEASDYLTKLVERLGYVATRWRCDVISAASVANGVINFASREAVDAIVMNTHDRNGLAKLT